MAFWGSGEIIRQCRNNHLIDSYETKNIECCSYELKLGNEAFVTSFKKSKKKVFKDGDQIVIGPGEFGLLIAKEKINIPADAMGLISIKAGKKFRGLVNVSGFHVDPGFKGYLKFSVYNAGSQKINLTVGEPLFLIWFADVIGNTRIYEGNHAGVATISSDDVMKIQGDIYSPAALGERVRRLEERSRLLRNFFWYFIVVVFSGVVINYLTNGKINELIKKLIS
jgi:dCTP deaminase